MLAEVDLDGDAFHDILFSVANEQEQVLSTHRALWHYFELDVLGHPRSNHDCLFERLQQVWSA